jgi:cysteine-rich repeat protein
MRCDFVFLATLLGTALAVPNWHIYPTNVTSIYPTPTDHGPRPSHTGDCGSECGGVCGDGIVQYPWEECDLGPKLNGAPKSGCSYDCQIVPFCGDGVVNAPGETCDLGWMNGVAGSGCSDNCTCVTICGNGIVEPGEECDAGSANGAYDSGCSEDCKFCGYCGDCIVDDAAGEQCDNGWQLNGTPGNPCSANCTFVCTTYVCGNGILEPGEECDHGANNGLKGDSCSANCTWVDCRCGNGITEYPEQCDDGDLNGTPSSHCSPNCTWVEPCGHPNPPRCGNGVVEYPEQCDDGAANGTPGSNCTTMCTPCDDNPPRCGDGHIDPGEECDDGSANGTPTSDCDYWCHRKPSNGCGCETCNPNPPFNLCTITTSCINTPSGNDYCACRAGYRADGLDPTDPKQFRLPFSGQEYRVFVAPGIDCDTLCTTPYPGPDSCTEVPVKEQC